jgi:hypothetical protein
VNPPASASELQRHYTPGITGVHHQAQHKYIFFNDYKVNEIRRNLSVQNVFDNDSNADLNKNEKPFSSVSLAKSKWSDSASIGAFGSSSRDI